MVSIISDKTIELERLCRRFYVSLLEVFGSVADESAGQESDIDFLVEFSDAVGDKRFDNYFALLEALKQLFGRPVDLVEPGGLRNPYFIRRVNETRRPVYVAS